MAMPNDLQTAADAAREALAANPLDQTAVAIRCSELLAAVDVHFAEKAERKAAYTLAVVYDIRRVSGAYQLMDRSGEIFEVRTARDALKWIRENRA